MTTKHTPGPWRYWACKVDSRLQPPMYDYAQFANPTGHVFRAPLLYLREEDARLIAAAPTMYEALKLITQYIEPTAVDAASMQKAARAAIAKAEGK